MKTLTQTPKREAPRRSRVHRTSGRGAILLGGIAFVGSSARRFRFVESRLQRPLLLLALLLPALFLLLAAAPGLGNTLVNQDPPPRIQNSPSVTIDPISGNDVIAYVDDPWAMNGIGVSYSAGGPWLDGVLPPPATGWDAQVMDPSVAADGAGLVYACMASFGMFPPARSQILVAASANGGVAFGPGLPVSVQAGPPGMVPIEIKPKLEVDDFPPSPYHRNVYVTWERDLVNWTNSDVMFSWSPIGGGAWSVPAAVNDTPGNDLILWPDLAVGPDGRVFVSWLDAPFWMQTTGSIFVDQSANGGQTFGPDGLAASFCTVPAILTDMNGAATYSAMSYPSIEVDPGNPNRVGMVYAADPDAGTAVERRIDGKQPAGSTYSQVNRSHPGLSSVNGWMYATWIDTRNQLSPGDIFFRRCTTPTGSWLQELNLTANHPNTHGSGCVYTAPTVASSGTDLHVAWTLTGPDLPPPTAPFVHVTSSQDNGRNWMPVVHLDTQGLLPSLGPAVACDGNNVYVAWAVVQYPSYAKLFVNRSTDRGQTWLPNEVTAASIPGTSWLEVGRIDLACTGNRAYLVWDQRTASYGRDIRCVVSSDGGLTWMGPTRLDLHDNTGYSWSTSPVIACTGAGEVYVGWYDDYWGTATEDPSFARSTDFGLTWLPDVRVSAGASAPNPPLVPQLAVSGNDLYFIYQSDRVNQVGVYDIYVSRSSDRGASWIAPDVRLDTGDPPEASLSDQPRISAFGANVHAAWIDMRNGLADVYGNQSTDSGATWLAAATRLDVGSGPGAASARNPWTASDANGPCTIWEDNRNGAILDFTDIYAYQPNGNGPDEGDIFYLESLDGGMTWSAPLRVNDDVTTHDQSHPWLDIKPNGIVDVVWYDKRNSPLDQIPEVYFAALLPGGSAFQTNLLVSTQPVPIPPVPGNWLGDYLGLDVDPLDAHIAWADTRTDPAMADIFHTRVPNPSLPTGACCFPNGTCVMMTAAACAAAGGNFLGDGTDCDPNPCPVLQDWGDHDVGNCILTVTDQGILGFMDGTQTQGHGFVFPEGGSNQLYLGGFWASREPTYVANRDYDADPGREWTVSSSPDGHIWYETDPESEQDIHSIYVDSGAAAGLGLSVHQESWAFSWHEDNDDFVILQYAVENQGPATLTDVYVGVFLDLDLNLDAYSDEGRADLGRQLVYLNDPSGVHCGLALLQGSGAPTPGANFSLVHNPTYVWPNAYISDADKYGFLAGVDPSYRVTESHESNDWSIVASAGPFDLGPGEVQTVAFAVVAGESLEELERHAGWAQAIYFYGPTSVPDGVDGGVEAVTRLLPNQPNPFSGETSIRFTLAQPGQVFLSVFDASGRRVRLLEDGLRGAGEHAVPWNGRNEEGRAVSAGVYFVKMQSAGKSDSWRVILIR